MTKIIAILSIFILFSVIISPAIASDKGTLKVIDSTGKDITAENLEVSKKNTSSVNNNSVNHTTETKKEDDDSVITMLQTAGENALKGFTNLIIDSLFSGAVNIFETDLNTEENGSVTYDIQVRELDPFSHPLVAPIQLATGGFLFLISIFAILGSNLISLTQKKHPEKYGDWKRSISGEYVPYNENRVHATCVWVSTRPVIYFVCYIFIILLRNYLYASAIQPASGVLTPETDNIVILGITGLAMFVGSFQNSFGEYGVYAFGTLLFIICIITDLLVMAGQREFAKQIENVSWGSFILFCFCDVINMTFTSFGVITSQWRNNPTFITDGIIAGGFLNFIIFAALIIYAVLKIKKASGV